MTSVHLQRAGPTEDSTIGEEKQKNYYMQFGSVTEFLQAMGYGM